MSELDLGGSATAPVTAPAASTGSDLVLAPPAPVTLVKEEQALGAIPLDDGTRTALQQKAAAFADKLASISSMGDADMRASAAVSSRLLDRPAAIAKGDKGDAQTRVAGTLVELRSTVTELDPARADLKGAKKVLKFLPGGDKIERYFQKYQSSQSHLNAIIKALESGQDELRKDNAAIETEKANMWTTMGKLSEYAALAGALDEAVSQKVAELQNAGRIDEANVMKSDALFAIRQRRQDIMTQMAVAVQGYMALDLVRKNNIELIKGVDRAQTTTIAALRTAVIVAQALARQKLVLDQITALNATTSDLIASTSEQLKLQGGAINQQAAATTIDIEKLQLAFDNVFQTMDAIDVFRSQAVDSMAQTVTALEGQITRARPYLERTRAGEPAAGQIGS